MVTKVMASTSGIVMPTTRPGRQSSVNFHESGLKCRPRLTKLTTSTISTASISTPTNSFTERDTTFDWFWNWRSSMPAGSSAWISVDRRSSAPCPSAMMSPPLAIEMPSAITSLALVPHLDLRRVDVGTVDRGDVAELEAGATGADRKLRAVRRRELNCPPTRTCTKSVRRIDRAGGLDRVLLADLRQHLVEVQAELGQALLRDLDEELFVLRAEHAPPC